MQIVTGEEPIDPESKRASMVWRYNGEKRPIQENVQQSTKKFMCIIFWDSQCILMVQFKERSTVVNGKYYVSLIYKRRDMIQDNHIDKLSRVFLLLHDNVPVYIAGDSKDAVGQCGFPELDRHGLARLLSIFKFKGGLKGKKIFNGRTFTGVRFHSF